MELLKEIRSQIDIASVQRGLQLLEAEYAEMLTYQVMVTEDAEVTLNNILNDVERRIQAAKAALSDASQIKDPAERKAVTGRALGHLNRTRGLLDKVANQFFPEKVAATDDSVVPQRDEFISPQQAAETLGISTSQLQSLVMANKLRMHNDGGKWALKGSEVQALADAPKAAPAKRNFGDALRNTDFGQRLSSLFK